MTEKINCQGQQINMPDMPDSVLREQQVKDSQAIELIAHKVTRLAVNMETLTAANIRMEGAITSLVRIEERQTTTNTRLDEVVKAAADKELRLRLIEIALPENADKRLSTIESKLPALIESRLWLIASFAMALGALFTAVFKGAFK